MSIKLPKSYTCNTGEQDYQKIRDFFISVKEYIENNIIIREGPSPFEIKLMGLCDETELLSGGDKIRPSLDKTHMLKFRLPEYGERIVAVVLETRTEFNYVHYDFFYNLNSIIKNPKE